MNIILNALISSFDPTVQTLSLGAGIWIGIVLLSLFLGLIVLTILHAHVRRRKLMMGGGNISHQRRAKRGEGMSVSELARRLDVEVDELEMFTPRFRAIEIRKRRGNGKRRLHVPDEATKQMQRRVLHRLLNKLRVHDAATGFERGRSIVDNAMPHVGQAVIIKMDIVDFFPSTAADRVDWYFRRVGWNMNAAEILTRITTYDGGLPQGAPTSPKLSNLLNFYLDVQLSNWAAKRKGQYTRYADDITFSFPKDYPKRVRGVIQKTRILLRHRGYQLHVRGKLRILRQHQQQRVTGLVVNEKVQLPRKTRRWLRAVEHHIATGKQATLTEQQLRGWQSLAKMVDAAREG